MATLKEIIRDLIDNVRTAIPGGRQFLDKSKDYSKYDVSPPRLPRISKKVKK